MEKTHTILVRRLPPKGTFTMRNGTILINQSNKTVEIAIKMPIEQQLNGGTNNGHEETKQTK